MSLYNQLAEIPVPVSAQFISPQNAEPTVVQVTYSVKDHARNIKRTMSKSIAFNSSGTSVIPTPLQDIDIVAQITSLSGKKTATLRNVKASGGEVNRIVEVWNLGALEISLNVTDHHGDFYTDEFVGSLSFSPSELSILYTAEANLPEDKDNADPYQKFRFNPDFGEGLVGKRRPATFVLGWKTTAADDAASAVQARLAQLTTSLGVRFGQAIFALNSDHVMYATGYELTRDGRMLGVKGCFNRPAGVWRLDTPGLAEGEYSSKITGPPVKVAVVALKLTPAHLSCRSPRFLRGAGRRRSTLLWLACKTGGAHVGASTLHAVDTIPIVEIRQLVGVVDVPEPDGFPGLYPAYNLTSSFSIKQSNEPPVILLGSQWGSRTTVLRISSEDGAVSELTPGQGALQYHSWTVLATDGNSRVVCTRSAPAVPYEVVLGTFDEAGGVSWKVIDMPVLPEGVSNKLSKIRTSILQVPGRPLVETILIQGEAEQGPGAVPPCITSPHGGPHGTTSTAFSPSTAAMVLEGYTMSFPNYSGSPGYGEKFLQALIGRCGELDVQDCIASALHLIALGIAEAGPGRQFITGGSHGGFLTAHLIGQFPDFFTAAVMRNPVISAGETTNTDIPDWYFAEFGLPYPLASAPPEAHPAQAADVDTLPPLVKAPAYAALQAASPIAHVDAMRVPVLLLIGAADRRVAPAHGIGLYHALRARYARPEKRAAGAKVEMLVFEGESHPLDGVEASRVGFEAALDWFRAAAA